MNGEKFEVDGEWFVQEGFPKWICGLANGDRLFVYKGPAEGREHAVQAYMRGYRSGLCVGAIQKQNEIKKVLAI